jgi:hypothetical protein
MRLHRAPGHFELGGNFRIVAALQQQLSNLLFARAQTNRLFLHVGSSPKGEMITDANASFPQMPCWKRPSPAQPTQMNRVLAGSPEIHSMHPAKCVGFRL